MTWEFERRAWENGFSAVCGVDEAGRGPIAGPVCAGAVILPSDIEIDGLNDSKKLSEKKRETLYDVICEKAVAWAVALVDENVIDEINILQATYRAMAQAVEGLSVPADFVYVDGNRSEGLSVPHLCVIGGDGKVPSVAAASILAKVTRDRLMRRYDVQYPAYGFAKHKGYETRAHDEALLANGPCPIHRRTFLKKFYEKHPEAPR
ncbi:ribonuclease HII [Agathobaculum sp.]|uniref:ribonuclease HII n=1 Tax=Agathobaculum sp. TaxID=2048138 RepID=UPI002A83563B|nr:ribonuclease HII [Agathobaculum sp.]MDY3617725.1 ribonuclease HII [Agathobaculum sp.]